MRATLHYEVINAVVLIVFEWQKYSMFLRKTKPVLSEIHRFEIQAYISGQAITLLLHKHRFE